MSHRSGALAGRPRQILVDGRTPVNYAMFAPVHAAMRDDPRVAFTFIASEEPKRAREIFAGAGPDAHIIGPLAAALTPFDAYLTSDFMWTRHLRRPCRIQMFHGVAGKYGFDAPTESMRMWDRLFFVNRRRLANFVKAGAIDAGSPAIQLIGMPKVDCVVDGSLDRDAVLTSLQLDPGRPTVLYAPTWSPASSLNTMGERLVEQLLALPINLIVKLHDRSRDIRKQYSGGIDWMARLQPLLTAAHAHLAREADICPYLVAADVMIADHSSAAFEFLLRDRPIVRLHAPTLIALANIHPDYVALLESASESVTTRTQAVAAIERALADPSARSAARRAVAEDLFHQPGTATMRCAAALYDAVGLEPRSAPDQVASAASAREAADPRSTIAAQQAERPTHIWQPSA